jgi:hypothetical protein
MFQTGLCYREIMGHCVPVVLGQRSSSLFRLLSLPVPGDLGLFIPATDPIDALLTFLGLYEQRPA